MTENEFLPVVWSLTTLRPYLRGEEFTVYSNLSSLRWLPSISDPSGPLTKRSLRLCELDAFFNYKKMKANNDADALLRLATLGEATVEIDDEVLCLMADCSART